MYKFIKIISVLLLFIFCLEWFYIYNPEQLNEDFTLILEFQLFLIYVCWLIFYVKNRGIANVFTLFLLCLGLFNYQKIFLGGFLDLNYRYADSLILIHLPEYVVQKTLYIYAIFTHIICFSYYQLSKKLNNQQSFIEEDRKLYRIGKAVMLLFYAFALYRSYLEFIALFGKSYNEIYTQEGAVDIPTYLKIAAIFYQVGFMMILASKPKLKNFIIFSLLYIIVILPNLFTGLRATFAVTMLILFWYYVNIYRKKVNLLKVFIPAILLMVLLQYISLNRENRTYSSNIIELVFEFLYQQSQSMYVLSLYIQYEDYLVPNSYPYVLDPLVAWAFPSGQSIEVINSRSSLGHQLTYSISPSYYLGGSSLGTNFIAELYEFGMVFIIIGGILFAYFIYKFEQNYSKSRLSLFLAILILGYFFIAPRSSFLPNFYFIFRCLLIYYALLKLFKMNVRLYFKI